MLCNGIWKNKKQVNGTHLPLYASAHKRSERLVGDLKTPFKLWQLYNVHQVAMEHRHSCFATSESSQ